MVGYAPDGQFLSLNPDGKEWHIRLRRADKSHCDEFSLYHGRSATIDDVRRFLPSWHSLKWRSASLGPTRGVAAKDTNFQVWLLTVVTEENLPESQIIAEFSELMGNAYDEHNVV